MLEEWKKQLKERSGNLTTNELMPQHLVDKILEEDETLKDKLSFEEIIFPKFDNTLDNIQGLNILAGLQKRKKKGYLTVFRTMRFPTHKRLYEMITTVGYAFSNYEQERILDLYLSKDYVTKRDKIVKDHNFWTQLQERVVHGLPIFCLVNDALQIHRAYRGETDTVAMVAIHIPFEKIHTGKLKLTANAAIDFDYDNEERDFEIKDYTEDGNLVKIDYNALRARGIDLHEMYSKDLPLSLKEAKEAGIEQEFFLLDIYRIIDDTEVKNIFQNTSILKENEYFMHGFFGDQSVIGRRPTQNLPSKCYSIRKK